MFHFILLVSLLIGCAHNPEAVTPSYQPIGSLCFDGLVVNLQSRCDGVLYGEVSSGIVALKCNNALPKTDEDEFYLPYTTFTFVFFDINNPLELLPDSVVFYCADNQIGVGHYIP